MQEVELHRRVIGQILADRAAETPERNFVHIGGATYTYGAMYESSSEVAGALASLGVERGKRVVMMLANRIEFIFGWFGTALAGGTIVPINPDWKGETLSYILTDAEPTVVILSADLLGVMSILETLPSVEAVVVCDAGATELRSDRIRMLRWEDLEGLDTSATISESPRFDDVLAVLYSSGTTGRPKGIVMPHAHVYSFGVQWSNANDFSGDDVLYSSTSLFYMQTTVLGMVPTLMSGAQIHIAPRFSASRYWDDVRATKATIAHAQFSLIPLLLKEPPSPLDRQHNCRRVFIAKSNEEFEKRFGLRIVEIYGSTELNIVCYNPWDHSKPGSAGKAAPNFEVKIVDEDDCELPTGQVGEIVARPKEPFTISYGYYHRPDFTLQAWRNMWFHCGDRGYVDEDGYFFFVDRLKDVIRRKGENIPSEEVERQVNTHPEVLESAAIPVPAETAEDEVKIFVVRKPDSTVAPEELIEYLRGILPKFMIPRYVEYIDALPRTGSLKIEKFKLRELGFTDQTWDREAGAYIVTQGAG
jgi:crotonobetaine/carnitine-CoA ligase